MQSSTASHAGNSHTWGNPNPTSMYSGTHQRSTSNPRAYTATDASSLAGRRDESSSQAMYPGEDNYSAYQHAGGYGGISGYAGYNSGMNLSGYANASSPSAPSGSRRTSGPKLATPPQAASSAANPSPSSRYYQTAATQGSEASGQHQSPYQPSSAPPQVLSHHQSGLGNQPQTAHPYASQYQQHYFDQHNQQHQSSGQWANYPASAYAQQSAAPRTSASHSTTTPTLPQSATVGDSHQQSHRSSSGAAGSSTYDYPPAAGAYQNWPTHDQSRSSASQQQAQQSWQQQQGSNSRSSQTQAGQPPVMQQGAWPGYPGHPSMPQSMPPHHMAPNQYGWQQQQQWGSQGYGYPAPVAHHTQNVHAQPPSASALAPAAPVAPGAEPPRKKGKKEKAEKPEKQPKAEKHVKREKGDDYKGLGKRQVESSADEAAEEKKEGKKKKGKKEEEKEKPVPKPPAKSHLHPPRQAQSAWQLFFTDELNKAKAAATQGNSPGGTPHHAKLNVAQIAKDAGIAYATLDGEQKKYYARKVQESKEQYGRELAVWQATLTPDDIKAENAFRAQQRKEGKSRKGNLKDPNAPKKPLSAYFLFLKGIRENDEIRAKVWGEESETTKQSVLAAERWRSLSDEEKKPYLQQAEHDKQEYEAARKVYEDEAAARARGEVPPRPVQASDQIRKTENKEDVSGEHLSSDPAKPSSPPGEGNPSSDPSFPDFQQGDSRGSASNTPAQTDGKDFDQSLEMDDFQGFTDPLEDMDLAGLEGITGGEETHEPQWDELTKLMGTTDDGFEGESEDKAEGDHEAGSMTKDSADLSIAPSYEEAVAQSSDVQQLDVKNEAQVQNIAASAEGFNAVPQMASVKMEGSGVPTEAINELPPAGVTVADDTSSQTDDTVKLEHALQPPIPGLTNGPAVDGV